MKRLFLLGLLVIIGTLTVCGVYIAYLNLPQLASEKHKSHAEEPAPLPPLKSAIDVDALAARMKKHQDVYQKIRDEALATYAKAHPGQHKDDDLAKMTLRLASYLCVWDDYYGEGLRDKLDNYADHLRQGDCPDQVWLSLCNIDWFLTHHPRLDSQITDLNHGADVLAQTDYPAAFKFISYKTCIKNIISSRADSDIQPPVKADSLPDLVNKAVGVYQELIRQKIPDDILFSKGRDILSVAQDDEATLVAISKGLDQAFDTEAKGNPTADILDGDFYVDYAWTARGSGYANTVTDQGWRLFQERLESASHILTGQYEKHPENSSIAPVMMTVVLGQQLPRDQMELWFTRGLRADPDNYHLYTQKRWYLLPRWYGSDEEVWKFGLECAASDNWSAKIPTVLSDCITDAAERNPLVYANPEVWKPLEKMFRAYLDRYPDSVHYRSLFAKSAVQGEHWDIAREQFKILGSDWDQDVFEGAEYLQMRKSVVDHTK